VEYLLINSQHLSCSITSRSNASREWAVRIYPKEGNPRKTRTIECSTCKEIISGAPALLEQEQGKIFDIHIDLREIPDSQATLTYEAEVTELEPIPLEGA
jgi:hypothetical protein